MPARLWQKIMESVDGLEGHLLDEELAAIKRYVERRIRETAQVTVTPVSTVQHCIPRSLNPEMPPDICASLESNEGKMDPELTGLESSLAGTGLKTPEQQCSPNERTWEKGRTIADGYLLVGMGPNQGGDISSPMEHVSTRARTAAKPAKLRDKTTSKENKQFDPGGKGEKASLWNAAVILSFFLLVEALGHGRLVVFASRFLSLCACLSALFFNYCSFQVTTFRRAEKHERRRGSSR
ncbi:unnamed protein product [Ascophyllum nodosum]